MITKFKKTKKPSSQSLIFSVILGIFVFGVAGFLIVSNFKINQRRAELISQKEYLQEEIKKLEQKKNRLQAQISESAEDSYIEAEARERFNLKKPGEKVVTVLPLEDSKNKEEEEKKWWNPFGW